MIVPFYAAILGILFVILSVQTIRVRGRLKIAVGDGGNPELMRAMRVHANFSEYTPICLILLSFVEVLGAPILFIHALCFMTVLGRGLHAFGVSKTRENFTYRISGMVLTFSTILICSSYLIIRSLSFYLSH